MPFDARQIAGYDSDMLTVAHWHRRISKAWRKKVKKKRSKSSQPPREQATRRQEGMIVTLFRWKDRHKWLICGGNIWIEVQVDEPIDIMAISRWLAKTTPIE